MDSIIEEIARVRTPADIRQSSLRRWQDYLRFEVQPKLDAYDEMVQKAAAVTPKRNSKAVTSADA